MVQGEDSVGGQGSDELSCCPAVHTHKNTKTHKHSQSGGYMEEVEGGERDGGGEGVREEMEGERG